MAMFSSRNPVRSREIPHPGIPIELGEVAYVPPTDSVRVQIYSKSTDWETEHQLGPGDDDLQLDLGKNNSTSPETPESEQ